jgi:glycogen debranching enzyme
LTDIVRFADEYYVRASSALADDRTRVLKYGDTFAVFNRFGDIEPVGPSQFGLFHAECRHLSRFTVHFNEKQPLLLSSNVRDDNAFLSVDLTNLDGTFDDGQSLARGTLHIFRLQYLEQGVCHSQFRVLNYGSEAAQLVIRFGFDADFADIFEVRGTKRERKGQRLEDRLVGGWPVLGYQGLDGVHRRTRLEFSLKPSSITAREACFKFFLEAGEEKSLAAVISCERDAPASRREHVPKSNGRPDRGGDPTGLEQSRITTSSEGFNAWLSRSSADLRMLVEGNPEGAYPYAGVPWFSTIFGRDGIITALECLWVSPTLSEAVLNYLAEMQATEEIPEQEAEPGKILHEIRRGEMAATKEIPFGCYYGSIDATPLFVMLGGAYFERTGNISFIKKIWPNIKRAVQWMDEYGDRDRDGFIEYEKRSSRGLVQQGWKDSYDSVFHADGTLAEPPIALCEVQGYAFAAKRAAAQLARALGETDLASRFETEADSLRARFEESFWSEELGNYVLALDGGKRQCVVKTSNAGHALFCGIADSGRAESVASTLMREQMFSGWGVRTVASSEARYNPMSYHNGSVWPHDNAIVAMGFSNYGMQHRAAQILGGLYESSVHMELQRMPELFCGFHKRTDGSGPTLYPVACAPQAWAAGSVFLLLQAALGIRVGLSERAEVRLSRPILPDLLDSVHIENLRVGDSSVTLQLRRNEQGVSIETTRQQGDVQVRKVD